MAALVNVVVEKIAIQLDATVLPSPALPTIQTVALDFVGVTYIAFQPGDLVPPIPGPLVAIDFVSGGYVSGTAADAYVQLGEADGSPSLAIEIVSTRHSLAADFLAAAYETKLVQLAAPGFYFTAPARVRQAVAAKRADGWSTADSNASVSAFSRSTSESWKLSESHSRAIGPVAKERFTTAERLAKRPGKIVAESLRVAEANKQATTFIRSIAEAFKVGEAAARKFTKLLLEALSTRDMYLRNPNGVVSDVQINNTTISLSDFENFMQQRAPVGYGAFKELVAGDYKYQNAILWLRLISQRTSTSTLSISQADLQVDVPDVYDSGTANIPAGGKTVKFNRHFNVIPEVVGQIIGGSVLAYPEITSISQDDFFIRLVSVANPSTTVDGVFAYNASGY